MTAAHRVALAFALLLPGCRDDRPPFRVESFAPDTAARPIRLNEPIAIRFSSPVDPRSVRESSFVVGPAVGRPARGELRVGDDTIVFVPQVPLEPTFEDAGVEAGKRYRVSLVGFPARLGIRATNGDPLESSFETSIVIFQPPADSNGFEAFVDPEPGSPPRLINGAALRVAGASVAPGGAVALEFSEPLAPRSVTPDAFDLRFANLDRDPVPFSLSMSRTRGGCVISLRPDGGFRVDTAYLLLVKSPMKLRDLVGSPVDDIAPISFRCAADGGAVLGRVEDDLR